MRRFLTVGAVFLLLSAVASAPASGVTAGGKCSVIGKKIQVGISVLVCKKNSRGVKVWTKQKSPANVPSPTATTPALWKSTVQILDSAWNSRAKSSTTFTYELEPGWELSQGMKAAINYMEQAADLFAALDIPITTRVLVVVGRFDFVSKRIADLGCPRQSPETQSDNCASGVIFYNVESPTFPDDQSVLIHEAFHQAQTDAAKTVGRTQFHYPLWLRQGGAEMMRNYVYGKLSGIGYEEMRRRATIYTDGNCDKFTLRSNIAQGRMTAATTTCDYTGGFFTVERLIAVTGTATSLVSFVRRSDIPLELYNRELTPGFTMPALTVSSYASALQTLFGKPAETFEAEMEAYVRKELFGP